MPQNIKINNVRSLDAKVYLDEYYDFMLYKGEAYGAGTGDECLVADFSDFDIDEAGKLWSTKSWTGATVGEEGVDMDDIGFTGIDNGFIRFRKDAISNQDFLNILTGSTYHIESGDTRFFMSPVTGNTLDYQYPMSAVTDDEGKIQYLSFNGGFYQGFYKLFGLDYQVLPNRLDYGWTFNFKLRPRCDYENLPGTINDKHPENEGMFFYMGTRAENKFWEYYPNNSASVEEFIVRNADDEGYMANDCEEGDIYQIYTNNVAEAEYLVDEPPAEPEPGYFLDGYALSACMPDCPSVREMIERDKKEKCMEYFSDDYFYYGGPTVSVINYEGDYASKTTPYMDCVKEVKSTCSCTEGDVRKKYGKTYVGWYMGAYNYNPEGPCKTCMLPPPSPEPCCPTGGCFYGEVCQCCEDYFIDAYYNDECVDTPKAIELDYLMDDIRIDKTGSDLKDSIGHLFTRTGYYEITTDNKFIFFNRTKTGFTTCNWTEGALVTLTGRTNWTNENLFLLMNRTCTGWTTCTIDKYYEAHEKPYDIYKDIKNNAFGLRITKDGAIGYRYGVLDCETSAANHYSVVEEYSKSGMVKCNEWSDITVKIAVLNPFNSLIQRSYRMGGLFSGMTICENTGLTGTHKIKIYVYVNGYLKLVSKELPEFAFRELNDVYQKQEGVPFSISLGGGTQGLMETIGPDYMNPPKYILPLERDFGGSFNGDIKSFKMYDCLLNYSTIKNYLSKNN